MTTAYATPDDVRRALQEPEHPGLTGSLEETNVVPPLASISEYVATEGRTHFFDSAGDGSTLVPTEPRTATDVVVDVPSSPHPQRGQRHHGRSDARYPVTRHGQYARVTLPHAHVRSLSSLYVRQRGHSRRCDGTSDWVADDRRTEGRGQDYYVLQPDDKPRGRSYLYIHAPTLGPRYDYEGVLTLNYNYGADAAAGDRWEDVRRAVAQLAVAQLAVDDDVRAAIPDSGQLIGVDTRRQAAVDDATRVLEPYLTPPR